MTGVASKNIFSLFLKYVSANVLGMIGYSCYILADTFFIARGIGADALAALNLVLPAYSLMNGTGLMIGMGAAARYTLSAVRPDDMVHRTIFTQALYLGGTTAVFFSSAGLLFPSQIAALLGADAATSGYAVNYIRILLAFSPLFIGNNILLCFVRNDRAPSLSMAGMTVGSLSNIVLDYIFICLFDMGMTGAAAATATAPIISMLILSLHFIKKKNRFSPVKAAPSFRRFSDICTLGISSLITEVSYGIVIIVFNFLILGISGNTGVAAYGILANIALVLLSVFTGIGQGIQPVVSRYAGPDGLSERHRLRRYAIVSSLLTALLSYIFITAFSVPIADLFNRDHSLLLTDIASRGMKIYFFSLFFSGINIIAAAFLSSSDRPKEGFAISVLRGFVFIVPAACILSASFGMNGIWLSAPVTEAIVCFISFLFIFRENHDTDA